MIQCCPFLLFFVISTLFSIIQASGSFDPSLMSSTQGVIFKGGSDEASFGSSVRNSGDINGDGIEDILIGNPFYKSETGIVYVIYGGTDLSDLSFDEDMDSSQGFKIEGSAAEDKFGTSLTALGDVNGDGVDDFLIVASQGSPAYGAVYVIYGSKSKLSNIDLSNGLSLSRGFTIRPTSGFSVYGLTANLAGDVNGDGVNDFILSMPGYWSPSAWQTDQGIVYVIYGSGKNSPDIALTENVDPSQGFLIKGPYNTEYFGISVNTAGDINDDGIDDIIIGGIDINDWIGHVYVFYGSKETPGSIDLNDGLNPTQGFAISEAINHSYLGISVSPAGDVNNDGIADIVIGAPLEHPSGSVYIIYGKKGGYSNISVADASRPSSVSKISSTEHFAVGILVSRAGDLNNDGIDDLYVLCNNDLDGSQQAGTAVTLVIYGGNNAKIPDMSFSASIAETQGLMIISDPMALVSEQRFSSGDFNNDNLPDILLGSPLTENNIGSAYIIFGSNGCQTNCSKCSSSTVCLECFEGLGLYKSQCVTCPKGTYFLENSCLDCPEGCAECTSSKICKSCTKGFILLSSQRCVSDSKSSQANVTGAALDSVSVIGNTVAGGTSLPTNFGLVAKILRNIRYMNITVSSDLEETFYTWKISSGFISMPESWGDYAEPEVLPEVFERYNLGNLFLVNYWKSLVMILIGLSLYVIFRIINFCLLKKNKNNKVGLVFRSLDIAASNFTLTQVYGSLDDVIFFFILQTRSADFRIDFGRASFALSVVLFLLGFSILGIHIVILKRYPRSSSGPKKEKSDSETQRFKAFFEKHENFKMFFQDFKDTNLMKQSFLLIYVGRSIISNIFITTLFEYPLLQTLLLTGLNLLILIYLMVCRPFKEVFNAAGQYFCEVVLLVVNVSMLGMGIIDNLAERPEKAVERFSQIVIIMNMTLVIGSLVFMLLSIGKILYMVYQEKKAKKKQTVKTLVENHSLKIIPNARLIVENNVSLDQSTCDPLNISRGQSFLENPRGDYHLNQANNNSGSTNLGIPSQIFSENSSGLIATNPGLPNTRKFSMRGPDLQMNNNSGFSDVKITHGNQHGESYLLPYMVSNFGTEARNMGRGMRSNRQVELRKLSENQSTGGNESNLQEETVLFQERKMERKRGGSRKIRILSD